MVAERSRRKASWISALVLPDGGVERDASGNFDHRLLREWGSVTKSLTAAAVTEAARRGSFSLDDEVAALVPRLPRAKYAIGELIEHRSGLLRVPWQMMLRPSRDPYRSVANRALPERWSVPLGDRGAYLYSNTGYAALGEVLDATTGGWWDWTRQNVFGADLARSPTLAPDQELMAVHSGTNGAPRRPWTLSNGPFAAAGGVWSTFDDLVAFARWSTRGADTPPGWSRRDGADFINGATRDAHVSIVRSLDDGCVAVVHSLGLGFATDSMAVDLLRTARRRGGP